MNNQVNSFTFYRDYFNLIDTIPEKNKKELLCAIVDYIFKDEEPNLEGHDKAIFNTLKSQLNVSKSNSKRKTKIKLEENRNITEIIPKEKPNTKPKENKTSVLSFIFYISNNCLEKIGYGEEKPLLTELDSLFNEYIEIRKKNKMIVSDTVINRLWNILKPYDNEIKKEMLGKAINGKWKDLYPPTDLQNVTKKKSISEEIEELI